MSKRKTAAPLLVVDDDPGLLRLAAKTLEREGHSVATASSGAQAVAWVKAHQADLLLLDLKLQDFDAAQVIHQLSELKRLPPFLIITGQGDERVAVEMMKSGAGLSGKGAEFLQALPSVVARVLAQIDQEHKLAAAELALRLSEERFQVALKNSPIMVFNQDAELRYTWVHNESVVQTGKDMLGKTDAELFPADESDRLTQIKARVLMTGTGLRQEVALTAKGEKHYYDLTVESVRDPAGRISGITGAAMEVTDRKRLEGEILQISEMEQRRIGQDLHDGICQHLAGIELKSQTLSETLKVKSQSAQAEQIAWRRSRGYRPDSFAGPRPFPVYSRIRRTYLRPPGTGRRNGSLIQRQMQIPGGRQGFNFRQRSRHPSLSHCAGGGRQRHQARQGQRGRNQPDEHRRQSAFGH